jgi:hypothetical protein
MRGGASWQRPTGIPYATEETHRVRVSGGDFERTWSASTKEPSVTRFGAVTIGREKTLEKKRSVLKADAGGGTRTPDTRIMIFAREFSGACGWSMIWLEKRDCADPGFGHFPLSPDMLLTQR